jgi:serine/threonine protein phosphatase 1
MRTFAIGDIHGCHDALVAVLKAARPQPDETIVFLGDYVDRGTDSRKVLEWLIRESAERSLVALRGNHEIMMMESRDNPRMFASWLVCGGRETLESYGWTGQENWPDLVPMDHWRFLEQTHSWMENDDFIFVHANAIPHLDMDQHSEMQLYWEKCHDLPPHKSGRRVVVGHTRQTSGVPRMWEGGVCIDTAAVGGHWLTCLELHTGEYWQSTIEGQTRNGSLGIW